MWGVGVGFCSVLCLFVCLGKALSVNFLSAVRIFQNFRKCKKVVGTCFIIRERGDQ